MSAPEPWSPGSQAALRAVGRDQFVTGEAVPLDLRIAQLPSRSMAITLDLLVQVLLIMLGIWVLAYAGGDSAWVSGLAIVLLVLIIVGYPVAFETLTRGRSLGKLALGLRVVRDDGGAARFRQALVRGLFEVVEIWMLAGVPAIVCSLLNSRGKRIGDLAAGTVVVRERTPKPRASPERYLNPQTLGWAASADLSRVGDDLALAMRQFLARAATLRPEARAMLGHQLAVDVCGRVMPQPPPGTPPEAVLAAVLGERRRREEARLGPAGPTVPTYVPSDASPYVRPVAPPPAAPPAPPADGFHLPR